MSIQDALDRLKIEIEKKEKRSVLSFSQFLEEVEKNPQEVLRNIFQLFHDMVKTYVGAGKDEYPEDPESIGFVQYDCSKLLVEGVDNSFFADRLFANRFIRSVEAFRQGAQQNQMNIFEGPSGCGKSTFFNNLLKKFEEYTDTKEGRSWEIFWIINEDMFLQPVGCIDSCARTCSQKVEVYCPSHDHPILLIPKNYRMYFLDRLFRDGEIRKKLAEKEYEWLFNSEVCTICKSLFWVLFDKLGSLDKVLDMVYARSYNFDRRLGEGISVFNPGDKQTSPKDEVVRDIQIQRKLDALFGANLIKYVFSRHAKTNNGIYALMDIKAENKERLLELHNIISEGVHKVGDIEERVNSLFFALMNPEDKAVIKDEKIQSFDERIKYIKIPYILEPQTEVKVYRSVFGQQIDGFFLPKVLDNFARVVISSRMKIESKALATWVNNIKKYEKYCDENGLLLRMEIYSGIIPPWLSGEDKKNFTAVRRKDLIGEAEKEGEEGFSGRESIRMFREFFNRYAPRGKLIDMKCVDDFFKHRIGREKRDAHIPEGFLKSLIKWYDYVVLNEVKEALYFYNKEQISKDILNYLFAVNHDVGAKVKCKFTGDEIEVTVAFFRLIGSFISGEQLDDKAALLKAQQAQQKYIELVAQELQGFESKGITETEFYQELFNSYVRNLKEKVLQPFLKNENFREAVKSFGTEDFRTFDTRLKDHISYMINNLVNKFGYTEQGAKEICLYVIDNKLIEKFS